MAISLRSTIFLGLSLLASSFAQETKPEPTKAPAASLKPDAIKGFAQLAPDVRELLTYSLSLTENNLTYTYSSSDPKAGGMDCSGTIYHVLQKFGWGTTPRQSDQMYRWTWEAGTFRAFNGKSMETFEMKQLQPGDLLFWTNTTSGKTDRDPPVTHVMMYLGQAADGSKVMFGASDGRTYKGIARWGVSVFDFQLPRESSTSRFIGYAHLPAKAKAP
jgi:cell wall-associated NlpC family hydrolase